MEEPNSNKRLDSPLEQEITNHILYNIFPTTGLDQSYFPKFMQIFWGQYPHGTWLHDSDLLDLCSRVVGLISKKEHTSTPDNSDGSSTTIVDEDLVLSMLFKLQEQTPGKFAKDVLLRFPKRRNYNVILSEMLRMNVVNDSSFAGWIEKNILNKKHFNRLLYPVHTNCTNIKGLLGAVCSICSFLFSEPTYKEIFLRSLYYIFFKKIVTMKEESIVISLKNRLDPKRHKGWLCLDFSAQPTMVAFLINIEEGYIYDYLDKNMVQIPQIINKNEFSSLIEGEIFPSKTIEAQVIAERIKFQAQEALTIRQEALEASSSNENWHRPSIQEHMLRTAAFLNDDFFAANPADVPPMILNNNPQTFTSQFNVKGVTDKTSSPESTTTTTNTTITANPAKKQRKKSETKTVNKRTKKNNKSNSNINNNINNSNNLTIQSIQRASSSSPSSSSPRQESPQFDTNGTVPVMQKENRDDLNDLLFQNYNDNLLNSFDASLNTNHNDLSPFLIESTDLTNFQKLNGPTGVLVKANLQGTVVRVHPIQETSASLKQQILEDIQRLSSAIHINVLKYFGIMAHEQRQFLITEFAPFTLANLIERSSEISIMKFLHLSKGIASGVRFLESIGIICKHLEPRNIEITEDLTVKISYHDISKHTEAKAKDDQFLSLKFVAPEALRTHQWTTVSNIYSYGVTLWQMLHLQEPFPGVNPKVAANDVMNGIVLQPTRNTYPIMSRLIQACIQHDTNARPTFANICELLEVVQNKLDERYWFYPALERSQAESLLSGLFNTSSFLIRKSVDGKSLALTKYDSTNLSMVHERVLTKENRFYLEKYPENTFYSLYDLVSSVHCFGYEPIGFVVPV